MTLTPYYDDGQAVIYHGDCRQVLTDVDHELPRFDLIFTSPPYNLGVTSGGGFADTRKYPDMKMGKWGGGALAHGYTDHDDAMPLDVYEAWQRDVLTDCWAQLSDRGAIFYNHKPRVQAGTLWLPLRLNPDLPLRQIIVWARAGGMNFAPTHYVPTHEWIMVIARPEFRLKSKGASGVGDLWRIPQESNPDHPAPFPLGLPARAIESTAPRSVLDPFMGSGTTLRAAKDAGVSSVGIEKSERYCEIAAKRLAQGALDFGTVS